MESVGVFYLVRIFQQTRYLDMSTSCLDIVLQYENIVSHLVSWQQSLSRQRVNRVHGWISEVG